MKNKDISVLEHMQKYCNDIHATINAFSDDINVFAENFIFKNSLCMCLLQIGELTTSLSDEFKNENSEINWRGLKRFRNLCAHSYSEIDIYRTWKEMKEFLPSLENFCEQLISEYNKLNNEPTEAELDDEDLEP